MDFALQKPDELQWPVPLPFTKWGFAENYLGVRIDKDDDQLTTDESHLQKLIRKFTENPNDTMLDTYFRYEQKLLFLGKIIFSRRQTNRFYYWGAIFSIIQGDWSEVSERLGAIQLGAIHVE